MHDWLRVTSSEFRTAGSWGGTLLSSRFIEGRLAVDCLRIGEKGLLAAFVWECYCCLTVCARADCRLM